MDPREALRYILAHPDDSRDQRLALAEWLLGGGFAPEAYWRKGSTVVVVVGVPIKATSGVLVTMTGTRAFRVPLAELEA